MAHAVSSATQAQFAKLADLLEQASRLARKLSQAGSKRKPLSIPIPELKRPKHVPKDQAWFWTEEWQAGERAANEDIAAGRLSRAFDTAEEFLADLHAQV